MFNTEETIAPILYVDVHVYKTAKRNKEQKWLLLTTESQSWPVVADVTEYVIRNTKEKRARCKYTILQISCLVTLFEKL